MSGIERVSGRAIVVRGDAIDTDRIIPARFLKAVTFDGLEAHVFADDRQAAAQQGGRHPFDAPAGQGAHVLFANANFGCGSSREHAPQAIARWGIRAIVAESFAEIFFGNALAIGLVCVTAGRDELAQLMALVDTHPVTEVTIDLQTNQIAAGGLRVAAGLPPMAREALLSGAWDGTGLLLERYDEVERAAARLPYRFP